MLFDFLRTEPCELRDYPEWRRGRMRYGLWMIPVMDDRVLAYIEQCRRELSELLHPAGARQAHLTLFVCGFECDRPQLDDDFPHERLQQQIEALQDAEQTAFNLSLEGIGSFSSAAYIATADNPCLQTCRDRLQAVSPEIRQNRYVPHITLGLYRQSVSARQLEQRLEQLPPCPPVMPVEQLVYATYEAQNQHSRLDYQYTLRLGNPLG